MYRETESFFKKSHAAISDTYSLNSYNYCQFSEILLTLRSECKVHAKGWRNISV